MTLENLGYNLELEKFRIDNGLTDFEVGRVSLEHKERYVVKTEKSEYESEITGNMRFSAVDRTDYPAVGDWVAISVFDEKNAIIQKIFPRKTVLERRAVAKYGEKQILAANVDYSLIVQAADRDFNVNRLERYLTISNSNNIEPIFILSKIDLINETEIEINVKEVKQRHSSLTIIPLSNKTKAGYEQIISIIKNRKTFCLLGSSGVGKSTLVNNIAGKQLMTTNMISENTNKGQHTTNHRELIILENGGVLIDTPGMRELGIADAGEGLEITFEFINKLSVECYFSDCTHTNEKNCAVLSAIEKGDLEEAVFKNFKKMEREKNYFESTAVEKRKKDKEFGKMIKEVMKNRKKNKI